MAWTVSGHAKCLEPPEGCGARTVQWEGKGQALLFHGAGCPIEAEQRKREGRDEETGAFDGTRV